MYLNRAKLLVSNILLIIIFILLMAIFWLEGGVLSKVMEGVIYIYGFVATVCAINIYFLNRLSVATDNIESLKEQHVSMVNKKISFFKFSLVRDIQIAVSIAVVVFIAGLVKSNTYALIGMKVIFPLSLFFIVYYIISIVSRFKAIDGLCLNISGLVRKEKNRQQLIQELKKAKSEDSLDDSDGHLKNYYSVKE